MIRHCEHNVCMGDEKKCIRKRHFFSRSVCLDVQVVVLPHDVVVVLLHVQGLPGYLDDITAIEEEEGSKCRVISWLSAAAGVGKL